jgi:hypothetical protein
MLWGFQQLKTKIPFLTNYPRVIGIQQEFFRGKRAGAIGDYPNLQIQTPNAVTTHS